MKSNFQNLTNEKEHIGYIREKVTSSLLNILIIIASKLEKQLG